jgi:hypothetical protein
VSLLLLAKRSPVAPKRKGKTDLELAANHGYRLRPGGPLTPGITSLTRLVDKPDGLLRGLGRQTANIAVFEPQHQYRFDSNSAYANWLGREAQNRWITKRELGTHVHEIHASWGTDPGRPIVVQPPAAGLVDGLASFWEAEHPRLEYVEVLLGNEDDEFGARADGIGFLDNFPGLSIWDVKTGSNRRYNFLTDALQLVGQWMCRRILYDEWGMFAGFAELPEISHLLNVYLTHDGHHHIFRTEPHPVLEQLVRDLADVWWGRKSAIDILKGKKA